MPPRLNAIYIPCTSLKDIEDFYGNVLELQCCGGAYGNFDVWIGTYLTFYESEAAPQPHANPPTTNGNQVSWSIELSKTAFHQTVKKIKTLPIPRAQDDPVQKHNHYVFIIRDPMGYTVELCYNPTPKD